MAFARPNKGSTGRRAVLYKYLNLKNEFAAVGGLDLTGLSAYTDTRGDSWDITGGASSDSLQLTSSGLLAARSSGPATRFEIDLVSVIPGLSQLDRVVAAFKISSVNMAGNGSQCGAEIVRRSTQQEGGWRYSNNAGSLQVNPSYISDGSTGSFANVEAHTSKLLVVENAGLSYGYRKQEASAAFPDSMPEDVPLFSGAGIDGYFHGDGTTTPGSGGVDLTNSSAKFEVFSTGNVASAVLEEIWVYRYE